MLGTYVEYVIIATPVIPVNTRLSGSVVRASTFGSRNWGPIPSWFVPNAFWIEGLFGSKKKKKKKKEKRKKKNKKRSFVEYVHEQ